MVYTVKPCGKLVYNLLCILALLPALSLADGGIERRQTDPTASTGTDLSPDLSFPLRSLRLCVRLILTLLLQPRSLPSSPWGVANGFALTSRLCRDRSHGQRFAMTNAMVFLSTLYTLHPTLYTSSIVRFSLHRCTKLPHYR